MKKILIQLDGDTQPSTFDAVVAIDSGVDHLLPFGGVQATSIEPLVHGAMFTRGGEALRNTAIFLGGSDVGAAETLLRCVTETFFGPVRVSVMMDANGCNTTASAAVVSASQHVELRGAEAVVLGGTGPVGQRVARLLAIDGASVKVTSRSITRAEQVCERVRNELQTNDHETPGTLTASELATKEDLASILDGAAIVIACGAAGIQFAQAEDLTPRKHLAVAIDLNAVPPTGLGGIEVTDKAKPISDHAVGYGAIGVGGLKMKTHRRAIQALFETNDQVLNAEEIYLLSKKVLAESSRG